MTVLWVAIGAAVGAPLRYLVDRYLHARFGNGFPWGTLTVNVVGSFVLGVVVAAAVVGRIGEDLSTLVGVGFCGALTTYSTFSHETWRLVEAGAHWRAGANVAVSVVAGVGAAALGWWVGS